MYRINDDYDDNLNKFKKVAFEVLDRLPEIDKNKRINNKELLSHTELINRKLGRIPECYKSAVVNLS